MVRSFNGEKQYMRIKFLGATQTVTGSKYLLEHEQKKFLIDCGLFQGKKELRLRNWDNPPFDVGKIHGVLLTHAHLDHSGYIPKLVARGYEGPIYSSEATYDLCKILLPDSGHIQEEDAERANRHGYTKHHPALPLYTEAQARKSLQFFKPLPFGQPHFLTDEVGFEFFRAGHILGAASIRVNDIDTSILFSGDVGRLRNPVMKPPVKIQEADYLVIESTYGNRLHDKDDPIEDIGRIVRETAARGGTVIIPAFAVGRTQDILYYLRTLKREKRIPQYPDLSG
jgi:metallo-beta-lactamase family protein